MVINDLQDYWTLVSAHREGDEDAKLGLELMAFEEDKAARLAQTYLHNVDERVACDNRG
jgi:hypothetical protein